jgi:TonB family protein
MRYLHAFLVFILIGLIPATASSQTQVSVSGKISGLPNVLPPGQSYFLGYKGGVNLGVVSTPIRPDGTFQISGILPGTYTGVIIPDLLPVTQFDFTVPATSSPSAIQIQLPPIKEIKAIVKVEGTSPSQPEFRFSWRESASAPFLASDVAVSARRQPDGTYKILLPEGTRSFAIAAQDFAVATALYGEADIRSGRMTVSQSDTAELQLTLRPLPGCNGCSVGGISASAPAPPATQTTGSSSPVRISEDAQAANLIFKPAPPYPPLALTARIEGKVILNATINADGSIKNLSVITSSNPLLVPGVIDAVKNWKYKPTLLNGQPVEVLTTITVNFALGQP